MSTIFGGKIKGRKPKNPHFSGQKRKQNPVGL